MQRVFQRDETRRSTTPSGYRGGSGQKAAGYYKAVNRRSREGADGRWSSECGAFTGKRKGEERGCRRRVTAGRGMAEGERVVDGGVERVLRSSVAQYGQSRECRAQRAVVRAVVSDAERPTTATEPI